MAFNIKIVTHLFGLKKKERNSMLKFNPTIKAIKNILSMSVTINKLRYLTVMQVI